jgi:hypothetical protein
MTAAGERVEPEIEKDRGQLAQVPNSLPVWLLNLHALRPNYGAKPTKREADGLTDPTEPGLPIVQ